MTLYDTWWHLITYDTWLQMMTLDHIWWHLITNDTLLQIITLDHIWWHLINYDDTWSYMMIPNKKMMSLCHRWCHFNTNNDTYLITDAQLTLDLIWSLYDNTWYHLMCCSMKLDGFRHLMINNEWNIICFDHNYDTLSW